MSDKDMVFISCGQRTDNEKALGNLILTKVKEYGQFEPYFAEEQNSLEGLTKNILMALKNSVGFIVVIHKREKLPKGKCYRASVWIEQEIAIAAFIKQALSKNLHVAAFIEDGVALDGMRSQLLLNPINFESPEDIINHLDKILPSWMTNDNDTPEQPLNIQINYKEKRITGSFHIYELLLNVTNTSSNRLGEYHIDLLFPRILLNADNIEEIPHILLEKCSSEICCFRVTEKELGVFFPGDSKCAFSIPYFVNDYIFSSNALSKDVYATAYVEGFNKSVTTKKSLHELNVY